MQNTKETAAIIGILILLFCEVALSTSGKKEVELSLHQINTSAISASHLTGLIGDNYKSQDDGPYCRPTGPSEKAIPTWRVPFGVFCIFLGIFFVRFGDGSIFVRVGGLVCGLLGGAFILNGYVACGHLAGSL